MTTATEQKPLSIQVTPKAAKAIRRFAVREGHEDSFALRVGVKGGGCSGFNYILDLTETSKDSDEQWDVECEVSDGDPFVLRVLCDPKSYLYLNGTEIDFKDEIMGRGFVFSNPNASSSCGCGSSFSV